MGTYMKTTVEITDPLFTEARRVADQAGVTLRALIEEGLRLVLDQRKRAGRRPFKLEDASVGGQGLHPDIRPGDWSQLRDLAYGGRGT
jgi:hypothetical protein